ncbi:hypothetical protein KIH39_03820 [Telmatocola sphagniphila]|uniref:FeoB-associated Cys-rich membrane protein n=1 Tax=Telmatocola sphagniphila TaxID=1123043 RepID=A0A8E6EVQ1_9BACT|nr:hypothetical protein [Telmatocola sphagniphila]QVL33055.1 hypothetical protein KIH39_03820 [Telmatocola sphagniphila]
MLDWQTAITGTLILGAALFVIRQFYLSLFGGRSACASCGNCSNKFPEPVQDSRRISLL